MNKKKFLILQSLAVVFAIGLIVSIEKTKELSKTHLHHDHNSRKEDKPVKLAPQFEADLSPEERFSSRSLEGKVWLFNVFFSSCPDVCPIVTPQIQTLLKSFPDLHVVSLSIDPINDSFQKLSEYKSKYQIDEDRHKIIRTESLSEAQTIATKGFGIGVTDNPTQHSLSIALVSKNGEILGYFRGTEPEKIEKLKDLLTQILK